MGTFYGIINAMRTTVTFDDETFRLVKQYADVRSMALGKASSELALRGLGAPPKTRKVNGLAVL